MKKLIIALLCLFVHFADAQNEKKKLPNNLPINLHPDTTINGTRFVWYNDGYVVKDQKIVLLKFGVIDSLKITRDSLLNLVKKKFAIKLGIGASNYASIQTVKNCPCDENLVLLSHPGIESVEIVPDPDGSSSGGNSLNESDGFNSTYLKKSINQVNNEKFVMPLKKKTGNAESLKVAFIDTGISTNDPAIYGSRLLSRVSTNQDDYEKPFATNFTNAGLDGAIGDNSPNKHGTNVAHILMGALDGQNNVQITPLKVFNNGHGVLFDALCAMLYAQKTGNKIINCSWGHGGAENPVFRDIINILDVAKITVVCSAGNKGQELGRNKFSHYPAMFSAKYNNVITVSIINKKKKYPSIQCCNYSSNYVSFNYEGNDNCEVAIPYSRTPRGTNESTTSYKYGSSYATAWVTGALAKRYFSFGNNPSNGERKQRFLNQINTNGL